MGGATLISGRTCSPTTFCPVVPPCTLVLLTACRRKSLPWLPPSSRSRSLLLPSASTPSGSVVLSLPLCPPSSPCGSQRRSTTSPAPASSTASASKWISVMVYTNFYFSHTINFVDALFHVTEQIFYDISSRVININVSQCVINPTMLS